MLETSGHRVRLSVAIALAGVLCTALVSPASPGDPCTSSAECDASEACHTGSCGQGTCVPAFTLPRFVVGVPGLTAYTAAMISVLDHTGPFYQRCCDTKITVFTDPPIATRTPSSARRSRYSPPVSSPTASADSAIRPALLSS